MNNWNININNKTITTPKYWQLCVGSGHAGFGLRKDWQEQLNFIRNELGFKSVRFHGILSDDMKVVTSMSDMIPIKDASRIRTISFYHIGLVFDAIIEIGMKPFVELGFMPKALASKKSSLFFYKANVSPPADYDDWADLIEKLVTFLVDRYGEEEVTSWHFEVWNEPDLKVFWKGTKEEYFKLYEYTVKAVKRVSEKISVGGPSTSGNKWLTDLKEFCKSKDLPLDFLSTHHYPGDALGHDVSGLKTIFSYIRSIKDAGQKGEDIHTFFSKKFNKDTQLKNAPRGMLTDQVKKAKKEAGDTPLIYTEWNSNSGCSYYRNDTTYSSAFIVKTILDNAGYVDGYSFWTFSDLFEELSFFHKPFSGSFGLLNIHGIPKPSFWAFKLLSLLGEERLDTPSYSTSPTLEMAVFKKGKNIQILLYNQQMPLNPIKKESSRIQLEKIKSFSTITIMRINENSGNPKKIWEDMGKPEYLAKSDISYIKEESAVKREEFKDFNLNNNNLNLNVTLEPNEVTLIEISI